jgi:hypothetical protein
MSESGLGCAKTPAVAPHVEISPGNCIPESQIILHTRGSMPCWRIVFSTFCGCMSFYTGSVKSRKARSEHIRSGLPSRSDIAAAFRHFRKVPCVDGSGLARRIVTSQAWSVQPCVRPHMMVSPSRADLGRSRSKGLSFSAGLPLQTSHPAGVDPSHCPAFGTGRAPRERHHSV